MDALPYRVSWSHTMLRAWVIVWMLAVPLFHVHPEADHHHGEEGHVHGGTVHTVFSPDLDGEFDDNQHATDSVGHSTANHVAFSSHPAHGLEYAELGFSFLSDSTDRKLPKPLFVHVLATEPTELISFGPRPSKAQDRAFALPLTVLTRDIPSRAPPSLLI